MRGYLLFALDTDSIDYTRLAYACALSIKITQPDEYNKVAIVTNNPAKVIELYPIFDNVITYNGPLGMDARSRALDYAVYDETVLLDSDMLFLKDMSHYWDMVKDRDIAVASSAKTFEGKKIKFGYYRKVFEDNKLPDVYNAWTYFKKDAAISKEFFDTVKLVTNNPQYFLKDLISAEHMTSIPTDEAFALAVSMLDIVDLAVSHDTPSITHMKGMVQGWSDHVIDWTDRLRFSMDITGQVSLGVWKQHELLHYVNKDIIHESTIKTLEALYGH
jgi:hypothetical protein